MQSHILYTDAHRCKITHMHTWTPHVPRLHYCTQYLTFLGREVLMWTVHTWMQWLMDCNMKTQLLKFQKVVVVRSIRKGADSCYSQIPYITLHHCHFVLYLMGQCVILPKELHDITEIIKDFTQSIWNSDKCGSQRDKQTRKRDTSIILGISWQMPKPKVGQGM